MRKPSIIIIIPAYNEEKNIKALLGDIKQLSLSNQIQVILIDDGSKDKTQQVANQFKSKINLKIIIHPVNQGVAAAFRNGLKKANNLAKNDDVIIIMEGDKTSDLQLVPKMVSMIKNGHDLVIASRYIKGGCYKEFPLQRLIGSWLINTVLKIRFYTPGVTDYTIFYRAYRAQIIKQALAKYQDNFIQTKSFASNLEILLKVKEFCQKIGEVPLVYNYGLKRGKSKMNIKKTLWEYKDLILNKL